MIAPPRILAACDMCWDNEPEMSCWPVNEIEWSHKLNKWLCEGCWDEYDPEDRTVVWAKAIDATGTTEDMKQRLIVAMTTRRLGVHT